MVFCDPALFLFTALVDSLKGFGFVVDNEPGALGGQEGESTSSLLQHASELGVSDLAPRSPLRTDADAHARNAFATYSLLSL